MQSSQNAIAFGKDEIDTILAGMSPRQIDELDFGAIQLDAQGTVLLYNDAQARVSGLGADEAIGRNFFRDVAPGTNTARFKGVFDAGVRSRYLNTMFDYVFDYKTSPAKAKIHMKKAVGEDTYWILVRHA